MIAEGSLFCDYDFERGHEGLYIDGWLQYATFDNVLKILDNNKKIADLTPARTGMGEWTAEFGEIPDITLIPSAQLQWNRLSFNDFMANGTAASLSDGNVINRRICIAAARRKESSGMGMPISSFR